MDEALYLKFRQHPDARERLLETQDRPLVLQDPSDGFWGSGADGTGENRMGQALERVRERIKAELMR
jgi:N-glycosidase YbiA